MGNWRKYRWSTIFLKEDCVDCKGLLKGEGKERREAFCELKEAPTFFFL